MRVRLPNKSIPRERYHRVYIQYISALFEAMGAEIIWEDFPDDDGRFCFYIDDKMVFMDYSDHPTIPTLWDRIQPCFKFHCKRKYADMYKIFPFPPVSFYDWRQYDNLSEAIKYTANNDIIIAKQKPYGNAWARRKNVHHILKKKYDKNVLIKSDSPQIEFWQQINNCLAAVFVPGCYNDMIDRGQLQYMAFGCCVISPYLTDLLPFQSPVPNIHYLKCADDYSDLIAIIEWCKGNRESCVVIGNNAKRLFAETASPKAVEKWVIQCLS